MRRGLLALLLAVAFVAGQALGLNRAPLCLWSNAAWTLSSLAAAVACLLAARAARGAERQAWAAFGGGCLAWFLGQLYWDYLTLVEHVVTPFPSWGDIGYQGAAVFFTLGMLRYGATRPVRGVTLLQLCNLGIVLCALLLAVPIMLLDAALTSPVGWAERLVGLNYAVSYLAAALFGTTVLWFHAWGANRFPFLLVLVGVAIHAVVQTFYADAVLRGTYLGSAVFDGLWVAGFLLIAWAARERVGRAQAGRPTDAEASQPAASEALVPALAIAAVALAAALYGHRLDPALLPYGAAVALAFALCLGLREAAGRRIQAGLRRTAERAAADAALSERRYRLLAENATDVISVHDADAGLATRFVSPSCRQILGYAPEALVGTSPLRLVDAEDAALVGQAIARRLGAAAPFTVTYRLRRRDDAVVWVESSGRIVVDRDGARQLLLLTRDVTERRRIEEALRHSHALLHAVVEGSDDPIFMKDREGRFVLVNAAEARILGTSPAEAVGRTSADFFPAETAAAVQANDAAVLESGQPQSREEVIPVDGERRIFLARKSPWRAKDGEILGILAITRDITQLKRQQAELAAARDAAQAANRAKSTFLANMSHELRTPLNAVIGFSELIEQAIHGPHGDERYRDYAGHVLTGGRHLLRLINEILDLSKIEAEQMVLAEAPVDLRAVIGETVRLLGPRAAAAGVTLGTDPAADLPACRGDELRLKQVLLNLLSNAIKFTPSGGAARIGAGLDGEGRLVVTVADTGIGIAAADMAKLFRPFGQVADAYSRPAEGSGLGLVIAQRLVGLHGGTLRLDSAPGEGTRAVVVLPADRVLARAAAA